MSNTHALHALEEVTNVQTFVTVPTMVNHSAALNTSTMPGVYFIDIII